jgi:ribosome silencing factor RsfS/YbeB/iojap
VSGKAKTGAVRKPAAKTKSQASEDAPEAVAAPKRAKAAVAAKPATTKAAGAKAAASKAKAGTAAPKRKPAAAPKPAAAKPKAAKAEPATTKASKEAVSAGPGKTTRARKQKPTPELLDRMVEAAVKSLEDDKAEQLVVLDVTGRASFADRMIVATGLAERQITAMAEHLDKALAEAGWKRTRVEASPDWVLIDAGDLIIHLFKPEARDAYAIERMWGPDSPVAEDS